MDFLEKSFFSKYLWVSYDAHKKNFGDMLTPLVVAYLHKKKIRRLPTFFFPYIEHYFIIGSILQKSTSKTNIWGSGLISRSSKCKSKPKKIFAVRGPLTKSLLEDQGIDCPEVFGDPALLMPEIYSPSIKKKYKLGVVPHYVDKNHPWLKINSDNKDILIIDVQRENPLEVIDDLLACEKIISSSLHGIIVADAYSIPSLWVEFSNKVVGEGFKFLDYFLSVGRKDNKPIYMLQDLKIEEIEREFYNYKILIDLKKLKESFPL